MSENNQIKNEIQGSGFLEEVKEDRLPDSEILTGAALDKYENKYATLNPETISRQADRILETLLEFEHEIYKDRERRVYRRALVRFLEEKYSTGQKSLHSFAETGGDNEEFTEYPALQEMFTKIEEIYNTEDTFEDAFSKILPLLYPAMDAISVSAQQSRRKRAGSSLRNHIDNLLDKSEYSIENTRHAGNGYIYQLTFQKGNSNEIKTIYVSFLTTLKDRFRQSLTESSISNEDIPRFLLTGGGNSIFTANKKNDITSQKVREITAEGFELVVFENVKKNRFHDEDNVLSYADFFGTRLPAEFN